MSEGTSPAQCCLASRDLQSILTQHRVSQQSLAESSALRRPRRAVCSKTHSILMSPRKASSLPTAARTQLHRSAHALASHPAQQPSSIRSTIWPSRTDSAADASGRIDRTLTGLGLLRTCGAGAEAVQAQRRNSMARTARAQQLRPVGTGTSKRQLHSSGVSMPTHRTPWSKGPLDCWLTLAVPVQHPERSTQHSTVAVR
jgi:hypothetical protein